MQKARIKLTSNNKELLNEICKQLIDVAEKTGAKHSGIIPLPTKKLVIPVRKGPSAGGTETYEKWQMRIYKRIIDIIADDRMLRRLMRVEIPEEVHMEIELKSA
ncbi:MAG: 30S ribosomal protein S10 [Candidatus Iainarchaeum archaeon]|uniref:Small ribosomal subunit protein uS10 n=1 Tax=Candidatus Iainarchaeum sp. TaxID=3101447 RepID=A0A497JJI4_9ARCH|nr:MAG: 30S ribosomal protein S10 [Candidatus Diapherotrites archaeon]